MTTAHIVTVCTWTGKGRYEEDVSVGEELYGVVSERQNVNQFTIKARHAEQ